MAACTEAVVAEELGAFTAIQAKNATVFFAFSPQTNYCGDGDVSDLGMDLVFLWGREFCFRLILIIVGERER